MALNRIKTLTMGLLLLNSIDFIYSSDPMHKYNNSDEILTIKQNLQSNNIKENIVLDDTNIKMIMKEDEKQDTNKLEQYKYNKLSIINKNKSDSSDSDDIDNVFENWTYNKDNKKISWKKQQYLKLMSDLQRNNTQIQKNIQIQPLMTVDVSNIRKLSDASKSSVKSHFSNPLTITHKNGLKKIDEYLNGHEEIMPIIVLQSDGLQVLDTIAHLLAFNSFFNLSNFGTNPYIFCASSASIPGLSLALDLQARKDPTKNLEEIGDKLYKAAKTKAANNKFKNKCSCSCNTFKLLWLNLFRYCIDYDEDTMIDSLYTKIPNKTANNIITDVLDLHNNSDINIPNLVIKDVNSDAGIVNQVLQANNAQDKKSNKNQIKLFAEPFVSLIKNFVDCKKQAVEKGIDFVENNIINNDLIKISSKDEAKFIQQNKLHDSTTDRLAIILSSDVDNNSQISRDTNNVKIEYKALEYEGLQNKLHTIKINLYTANSVVNSNYSLEEKYNNVKSTLDNSIEFKYLIKNLPQIGSSFNSSLISEDLKIEDMQLAENLSED